MPENGTKRVLGFRQGATENATASPALLEDLLAARPPARRTTTRPYGEQQTTAHWLDRLNSDAVTNPIEAAENVTRRVQRWREGDLRQGWCAANREQVPACQRLPPYAQLLKALDCLGKEIDENRRIA